MIRLLLRAFAGAMLFFSTQGVAQTETRVALVIANGAYTRVAPLPNPGRDGNLVAQSLRRAGFSTVEVDQDLSKSAFDRALLNFRRLADNADVALIYFAGHGLEVDGVNWLLPVDARLEQATDVHLEAVSLDNMLRFVSGARRLRIVILDACRNNPFAQRVANGRSVMRGLSPVEGLPRGTLVAYSASSGQVAADGEAGSNSPFAVALADRLIQPGLEIRFLFAHVRDDVMAANPQGQEPWLGFSLSAEEYFLIPGSRRSELVSDQGAEVAAFNRAAQTWTAEGWQLFLRNFPSSRFRGTAETALANLANQPSEARSSGDIPEPARRAIASLTPQQIEASSATPLIAQVIGASSREAIEQLAASGDATAQWLSGAAYLTGSAGFPQDLPEAARLFRLSAAAGFARAQLGLGTLYGGGGGGLPRNPAEGARLVRLAVAQGNAVATAALGRMYLLGAGVPRDEAEGLRLIQGAVARDCEAAMSLLGAMYHDGVGVGRDHATALRLLRIAAGRGDPSAQANLGVMYEQGEGGLERNEIEAARLYRLAANSNYPLALSNLGLMFKNGRGGLVRDEREAVRLYRHGAELNYAPAQNNLAVMYEQGRGGLARDLSEATRLYRLAAAQGYGPARTNLERLGQH